MKRITDQLAKEIVAAAEGERAGVVINAFTDEKLSRVRGYKTVNDEDIAAKLLPLRRVLGDKDALVVKTRLHLKEAAFPECPLGAKVYDTAGAAFGCLRDLLFDERTGAVTSLVVEQTEVAPDRVLSFGKNAVVLRSPLHDGTLFKRTAKRSPAKRAPTAFSVVTAPVENPQEAPAPANEEFLQDYAFLLGRTVKKTILNGDAVVAEEGEIVTAEVVLRARENGKLVELTVNSRK